MSTTRKLQRTLGTAPSSLSFHQSTLRAASDATQREIGFELSVMAWSGGSAFEVRLEVKGEDGVSLGRRGAGSDAGKVISESVEVRRVKEFSLRGYSTIVSESRYQNRRT